MSSDVSGERSATDRLFHTAGPLTSIHLGTIHKGGLVLQTGPG